MPALSGKRAFIEVLKQEGVAFMFGNPGTTELPLMDALAVADDLRYVLALQEAAVMAMADGYAQASGKLAVVSLHVTPGLGNAMGMLYDAQKAGSPILVTAGQHDQDFSVTEPILWADLPTLARPLVKWSSEVRRLRRPAAPGASRHQDRARAADRPGLPVAAGRRAQGRGRARSRRADARRSPHARRPRGDGGRGRAPCQGRASARSLPATPSRYGRALPEIVALAETLGAPVYAELIPSTASFPASHPLYRGNMVRLQPVVRRILEQHDLLFSVGADLFAMSLPSETETVPPGSRDHSSRHRSVGARQELSGLGRDPRRSQGDPARADGAPRRAHERARARPGARAARRGDESEPGRTRGAAGQGARGGRQAAGAATGAVRGAGRGPAQERGGDRRDDLLGRRPAPAHRGRRCAEPLRAARRRHRLGPAGDDRREARAAASGRCVGLIGDGSAMYTCQALWTAAHDKVPAVWVILNNGSYRILKQRLNAMRGHAAQADRYRRHGPGRSRDRLCRAWRARWASRPSAPTTVAEAVDLVKQGLAAARRCSIDVAVDRTFKPV